MSRSQILTTVIGFFLVTFAIYGLSLGNTFVAWDDNYLIVNNIIIRGLSWEHIRDAFTTYDPELYDPLVFVGYMLAYMVSGTHAFAFHLFNLLLHTLNALGVCAALCLLTRKQWIGIVGGLLFAVHPLNTEAVSWAAALKDVLSTFFFLLSLLAYLFYRERPDRAALFFAASLLFFLLGLLSKVMVLTLPAVLILVDLWQDRKWTWRMILEKIPFGLLSVIFGMVALFGKQDTVTQSTPLEKILMAAKSTIFYIESFFLPVHLSVLYPYSKPIAVASPDFFVPLFLVIALLAAVIVCWKRYRAVSIGILFYLITLIPTFFNFAKGGYNYVASDRYAYIPQIGIILLLLIIIDQTLMQRRRGREIVLGGASIIIIVLSALAFHQSLTWKNTETLFLQTLAYHPDALDARINLGYVYRESKLFDKALAQFNAVLAYKPQSGIAYANIGQVYEKEGNDTDAIAAYLKGISVEPKERDNYMSLGMLYERQGKIDDALMQYQTVATMYPAYSPVYNNLGSIYVQKGENDLAQQAYEKAIAMNPYYADAHFNLGYLYAKDGRLDDAEAEYEKTISIEGPTVETLHTLAGLYAEQNKTADTVRTLKRILAIDPTNEFATKLLSALQQSGLAQ